MPPLSNPRLLRNLSNCHSSNDCSFLYWSKGIAKTTEISSIRRGPDVLSNDTNGTKVDRDEARLEEESENEESAGGTSSGHMGQQM